MSGETKNSKDNLIARLNRIEGQIRGIKNMIEDEKYCVDILIQIAAAKSALNSVGVMLLETHIQDCVKEAVDNGKSTAIIDDLMDAMKKYIK